MTRFSKVVFLPLLNQEERVASPQIRPAIKDLKILLANDCVDRADRVQPPALENFLNINSKVKVVYEFRERLRAIWIQSSASQKELLERLHKWCHEAENTGIQSLKEFGAYIRGCSLKMV